MKSNALRLSLLSCLVSAALLGCGRQESPEQLLSSARNYLAQGDRKAAVIQVKNALQQRPEDVQARLLLARLLLEDGDAAAAGVEAGKVLEPGKQAPDEAVPLMARVLLAQGKARELRERFGTTELADAAARAELQVLLAQAWLAVNDRARAEAALQAALAAQPGYAPAQLLQVQLQAAVDRDADGAMKQLEQVLQQHPKDPEGWLLKAGLLRRQGDLAGAEKALQEALAQRKDSLPALAQLAELQLRGNRLDDVAATLARLKAAHPGKFQTLMVQGQLALRKGDAKTARETAQALLKVLPEQPAVLLFAGAVEFESGSLLVANQHLSKALQVAPGYAPIRVLLARTQLREGEPAKALATLEPLLQASGRDKGVSEDAGVLALAGQAAQQQGDFARAEGYFRRAATLDPGNVRTRTALALNHLANGQEAGLTELQSVAASDTGTVADLALVSAQMRRRDWNGALAAIDTLEKKAPGQAQAPLLRARVQLALKQPDAARRSFERVLQIDALQLEAAAGLAALDLQDKHFDAARKRFDPALQANPRNVRAILAVAAVRTAAGAPAPEVAQWLQDAVRADPQEPRLRAALVQHHASRGENEKALAAAREAVAALPNDAEMLALMARVQAATGDLNQSVRNLGQVAAQRPDSVQAQLLLAEAQVAAKEYGNAVESLKRARELAPRNAAVAQRLAQVHLLAQQPLQAMGVAQSLQKDKDLATAGHVLEGDVRASQKQWKEAAAAYRAALVRRPETLPAIRLHGALAAGGDTAGAESLAVRWQAEHPGDLGFAVYLAEQALARSDFALAEQRFHAALKIRPDAPVVLNNLAWVQVQLKRPEASQTAQKANELAPDVPAFLDTWALALGAQGDWKRAIELQQKAAALEPRNPAWQLALAKLYIGAGQRAQARSTLEALAKRGQEVKDQAEVQRLMQSL